MRNTPWMKKFPRNQRHPEALRADSRDHTGGKTPISGKPHQSSINPSVLNLLKFKLQRKMTEKAERFNLGFKKPLLDEIHPDKAPKNELQIERKRRRTREREGLWGSYHRRARAGPHTDSKWIE